MFPFPLDTFRINLCFFYELVSLVIEIYLYYYVAKKNILFKILKTDLNQNMNLKERNFRKKQNKTKTN